MYRSYLSKRTTSTNDVPRRVSPERRERNKRSSLLIVCITVFLYELQFFSFHDIPEIKNHFPHRWLCGIVLKHVARGMKNIMSDAITRLAEDEVPVDEVFGSSLHILLRRAERKDHKVMLSATVCGTQTGSMLTFVIIHVRNL